MTTPLPTHSDVEDQEFLGDFGRHLVKDYGLTVEQAEDLEMEAAELYAHDTADNWCCACEADIAFLNGEKKLLLERLLEQIPEKNDGYDFAKLPNHLKPYYNGFNEATDKITEAIKQMMEELK